MVAEMYHHVLQSEQRRYTRPASQEQQSRETALYCWLYYAEEVTLFCIENDGRKRAVGNHTLFLYSLVSEEDKYFSVPSRKKLAFSSYLSFRAGSSHPPPVARGGAAVLMRLTEDHAGRRSLLPCSSPVERLCSALLTYRRRRITARSCTRVDRRPPRSPCVLLCSHWNCSLHCLVDADRDQQAQLQCTAVIVAHSSAV